MGQGMSDGLPSALDQQDVIASRLQNRSVALFLDYDGTLTPIVQRPEDAILSAEMRDIVRRVATCCPVAIVSGRDRRTVEQLVDVKALAYVGSHGFDIVGAPGSGIRREVASEYLPTLDAAEAALRARLADVEGALVERKKFTVAIHFRLVAAALRSRVEDAVDAVHAEQPTLRKEGGKAVFELRPDLHWDKGTAVLWLLEKMGLDHALPIHIGDDLTDETVFGVLGDGGIGIVVADERRLTAAQFTLRDTGDVARFLSGLTRMLSGEPR